MVEGLSMLISVSKNMNKIERRLSITFDFIRFPLALLVVYLHIAPNILLDKDAQNEYQVYYWIYNCICTFANLAVPCFFVISGYLMSFNMQTFSLNNYKTKLYRRIFTLVIPYIIWNILCVGYLYLTKQIYAIPSLQEIFIKPVNFPLWFLRNLIVLNLFFPIFWWLSRYLRYSFFIICIFTYLSLPLLFTYNIFELQFILSGIMFFTGVFLGMRQISVLDVRPGILYLVLGIGLVGYVAVLASPWNVSYYINNVYLFFGTLGLLIGCYLLVDKLKLRSIPILASGSFFIYVFHKLGPTYISKQIMFFLPEEAEITKIIVFLISPLITCLICLSVYLVLIKISPRFLKILTGK